MSVGNVRGPGENGCTDRDAVCGAKEPCIRRGQGRTNPFAATRGDKMAMRPFVMIL